MREPQFDKTLTFSAAAAATTSLAAATVGARHRIHGMRITAAGAVVVTLQSAGNVLEKFNLVAGVPLVLPLRTPAYMRTNENEALQITLGGAVQVDAAFEVVTG